MGAVQSEVHCAVQITASMCVYVYLYVWLAATECTEILVEAGHCVSGDKPCLSRVGGAYHHESGISMDAK